MNAPQRSGALADAGNRVALSFVIPVYRGARTVGAVVEAIATLKVEGGVEVVLVNDCSPDDSAAVCRILTRRTDVPVTLVNLARNSGEHNAVITGLRYTRGDYVITVDDDLQNPITEALRVFEHARAGEWDIVFTRYAVKRHDAWRNLGSRFANRVADWLLDKPKGLYLSSFRCMSRFVVDHVTRYHGPYPYIDGLALQVSGRIDSIEVEHLARESGPSSYTLRKLVRLWLNLFVNFSVKPLRIASGTGLVFMLLGVVGALFVIMEALIGTTPPGWASLSVATLLLSGVQLLMLGVVGEYLGNLVMTVNGKPQSVVREVVAPGGVVTGPEGVAAAAGGVGAGPAAVVTGPGAIAPGPAGVASGAGRSPAP